MWWGTLMDIRVSVDFDKARKLLAQLSGAQAKQAMALALNDSAFEARRVVQEDMRNSLDRVTPYILRSVQVKKATAEQLVATVEPTYLGGKGVDPQNILKAEIFGGDRKLKRSERALQRVGILPTGYYTVPGTACPLDQYGNIRGSFIVQLLSYFAAFGEQGYKANMTDKRKKKLADKTRFSSLASRNTLSLTRGSEYFISYGKLRGGKGSHLPPGIWSRSGIHGGIVKPIIMFVRKPGYKKRLDFFGKPIKAAEDKFNPRLRYHLRTMIEGLT